MTRCDAPLIYCFCSMLFIAGCGEPAKQPPQAAQSNSGPQVSGSTPAGEAIVESGGEVEAWKSLDPAWIDARKDRPFEVAEYLATRKPSSDEEKRFTLYQQGLKMIASDWGSGSAREIPGRLLDLADVEKLVAGGVSDSAVAQILADTLPAVAQFDQAQQIPLANPRRAVFMHELRIDALAPESSAARQISRLMLVEIYHARRTNRLELAHRAIESVLSVSRDLQPRNDSVGQFCSFAIDSMVVEAVTRFLLDHPQLATADCDRMLAALNRHQNECLDRFEESLKADYLVAMDALAAVRSQQLTTKTALQLFAADIQPGAKIPDLDFEIESSALSKLTSLALQDALIPYAQLPENTSFDLEYERTKELAEAETQKNNFRTPFATVLIMPATENIRSAQVRTETSINALKCLLALRRYELVYGSLPASLENATSEAGLKEIPQDLFVGSPLKYVLNNRLATIYSVGKDRHDDGGKLDWKLGQQPGDFLFVLPPLPPGASPSKDVAVPRKWTSIAGTTIDATLISFDEQEVVLRKLDGTELRVRQEKLSKADREWLKGRQ